MALGWTNEHKRPQDGSVILLSLGVPVTAISCVDDSVSVVKSSCMDSSVTSHMCRPTLGASGDILSVIVFGIYTLSYLLV